MPIANGASARMVADATLRVLGGCSVSISAATPGADAGGSGLGVGGATQQQWVLEPVAVRWRTANEGRYRELLVSAETLECTLQTPDTETVRALLLRSQVKLGNETLRATEVGCEMHDGDVYLYRVRLER